MHFEKKTYMIHFLIFLIVAFFFTLFARFQFLLSLLCFLVFLNEFNKKKLIHKRRTEAHVFTIVFKKNKLFQIRIVN